MDGCPMHLKVSFVEKNLATVYLLSVHNHFRIVRRHGSMVVAGIGPLKVNRNRRCPRGAVLHGDLHSGPTPRGKLSAAATRELARVLRSTTRPF